MKGECFESAVVAVAVVVAVVVVLSVFVFGGRAGASQLPGCEGEGGPVSFGVVFCGEWRRASFWGCEGGMF